MGTETFLTVTGVTRLLDQMGLHRSNESVRLYNREGKLPAIRTEGGIRLFRIGDVEAFAKKYLQSQVGSERI